MPRIVEAMSYIDEDLVSWAVEYKRPSFISKLLHKPILKVCACFLVVVLIVNVVYFCCRSKDRGGEFPMFVLTAYAMSPDDRNVDASLLEKGQRVPICRFETTAGLYGFVFSCNKPNDNKPSTIIVISAGHTYEQIDSILGMAEDPSQNYYIYIPGENESEPFAFSLLISDDESPTVYRYQISIEQIDNAYYAELVEEETYERISK